MGKSASPQIRSIAVLPLENLSGDPSQEYFSDGMTDALITDLAQIGSVKVISRTSSMQYKQTKKSLPEIARELNVDGIIEGTVQRSSDRVRITAQLIHGPSDKHLWANSYERDLRDVFALERDVTQEIVHQVQAQLTPRIHSAPDQPRPVNPKALEAYLQGNYHLYRYGRGSGDEEKRKAAEYFQQAIDADSDFPPAYVGIARAHNDLLQSSSEDVAIMKRAADTAVVLDPFSSDARSMLAKIKFERFWDWPGAEEEIRRAIALNPNNSWAHDYFCEFLDAMGRLDEGLRECEIAQQLDPYEDHLTGALENRGEYGRATELLRRAIENHPENGPAHYDLHRIYAEKGMYKESIQELEQAASLFGFSEIAPRLHRAFGISGFRGAMREWGKELEHLAVTKQGYLPVNIAEAYTQSGDKDRAFYWLEQAYEHRDDIGQGLDLLYIKMDPLLSPLRSDPRFKDLLHRIGLPP